MWKKLNNEQLNIYFSVSKDIPFFVIALSER